MAAVWWGIAVVGGPLPGPAPARRRRRPRRPRRGPHGDLPAARVAVADRAHPALADRGDRASIAGGLGLFFPGVAAIGAGYALLVALAWRTREAAVLGVEQRDGTRFYVEPTSAFSPVELVRTPGLGRERTPAGHPPPPPPALG